MRPSVPTLPASTRTLPADLRVTVDGDGVAHPEGAGARSELENRHGTFHALPSPRHVHVLRRAGASEEAATAPWLAGEVTRPGLLWEIISMLGQCRRDGEFVVEDAAGRRTLFLQQGQLVAAGSSCERERIGSVLYRYGVLALDQISRVVRASTRERRFGETAVELGLIQRSKLHEMMDRQAEEIFFAVMAVSGGSFYFVEGFDERRIDHRAALPVSALLLDGVRRLDEMDHFRSLVPAGAYVPLRIGGARPGRDLAAEEMVLQVLAAVDGSSTIEDLARRLRSDEFTVTRAVYHLLRSKHLALRPPRIEGAREIARVFNQAIATVLSEADRAVPDHGLRASLASFAAKTEAYGHLFDEAGPRGDGSVDPNILHDNADAFALSDEQVAEFLYEYASFAAFVAQRTLRSGGRGTPARVAHKVAEYLKQIDPTNWRET